MIIVSHLQFMEALQKYKAVLKKVSERFRYFSSETYEEIAFHKEGNLTTGSTQEPINTTL